MQNVNQNFGDNQHMKKMLGKKTKVQDEQNLGGNQLSSVEIDSFENVERNGD